MVARERREKEEREAVRGRGERNREERKID